MLTTANRARTSQKCSLLLVLFSLDVVLSPASLVMAQPGTFTPTGSMTAARVSPTATLLADGRVLIAGRDHRHGGRGWNSGLFRDGGPATSAQFGSVSGLAVDRSGNLISPIGCITPFTCGDPVGSSTNGARKEGALLGLVLTRPQFLVVAVRTPKSAGLQ